MLLDSCFGCKAVKAAHGSQHQLVSPSITAWQYLLTFLTAEPQHMVLSATCLHAGRPNTVLGRASSCQRRTLAALTFRCMDELLARTRQPLTSS